ncbi:protein IL-40 [Onychomys torridus]|uniref:protein IL-40 n=1 Tax=Onychomys torridus TaxID=38674 RepID=UPI00167F5A32|nr:protein IL-40 [Onychomys torridus]
MRLLRLLFLTMLAACSLSGKQTEDITIAYKVLEVYPQGRQVLITCDIPEAPRPITYSLIASRGLLVTKRVVHDHKPVSFKINITLKSSPDLLTYSCQAASHSATYGPSTRLQMYWELWAKPVSQLQADFTLYDGVSGPTVELSCLASSGSPPIIYSLVGNDGHVHAQQRPLHGKPANFSIPLSQMSGWFHCEAANSISVDSSARVLLPPGEKALPGLEPTKAPYHPTGELPVTATCMLAGSLVSISAISFGMLRSTR